MQKVGIKSRNQGFTIVELLIVIVIIGILAALVIVAYNGIQQRARDADRDADLRALKTSIELYKADFGYYPAAGTDNIGYSITTLSATLVPTYIRSIPQDPQYPASGKAYSYVRGTVASDSYAIYMQGYESKPACKSGNNVNVGWWGSGVLAC
ncbi:MAG: prepilin-type N-terminal cleavage/methylation domain-containing protein [Candidatus Saccharibacteria bacterium]|nr:prepilin-type N-terminal cleavage/methylation domain-containing protein [Candidatus Saccharibacteria bacterium]